MGDSRRRRAVVAAIEANGETVRETVRETTRPNTRRVSETDRLKLVDAAKRLSHCARMVQDAQRQQREAQIELDYLGLQIERRYGAGKVDLDTGEMTLA